MPGLKPDRISDSLWWALGSYAPKERSTVSAHFHLIHHRLLCPGAASEKGQVKAGQTGPRAFLWVYREILHTHENHYRVTLQYGFSFVLFPSEISMHQVTKSIRENWPWSHLAKDLPNPKGIYYSYKQWGIWLTFPKASSERKVNDHSLKWKQEIFKNL